MVVKQALKHLVRIPIYSVPVFKICNTRAILLKAIEQTRFSGYNPASIFIDIQGYKMGKNGEASTMNLYINDGLKHNMLYVIDLHTLKKAAFEPFTRAEYEEGALKGSNGRPKNDFHPSTQGGLKALLENENMPKVFWDIRRSSNLLFHQYGIRLNGVREVQLMEYATRPVIGDPANIYPSLMVRPLDAMKVISTPKVDQQDKLRVAKFLGRWRVREFNSQKVGPLIREAILERPLDTRSDFLKFCTTNVRLLPTIYDTYAPLLATKHWKLVNMGTNRRLALAENRNYDAWEDSGITMNTTLPWTTTEKTNYLAHQPWREQTESATHQTMLGDAGYFTKSLRIANPGNFAREHNPAEDAQAASQAAPPTEQPKEQVTQTGAEAGAEAAAEMEMESTPPSEASDLAQEPTQIPQTDEVLTAQLSEASAEQTTLPQGSETSATESVATETQEPASAPEPAVEPVEAPVEQDTGIAAEAAVTEAAEQAAATPTEATTQGSTSTATQTVGEETPVTEPAETSPGQNQAGEQSAEPTETPAEHSQAEQPSTEAVEAATERSQAEQPSTETSEPSAEQKSEEQPADTEESKQEEEKKSSGGGIKGFFGL